MALNKVGFTLGQGGLGRPVQGTDHISGFVFGGLASQKLFRATSTQDAIDNGINLTYADETKATATSTITNIGVNGETYNASVTLPTGEVVVIAEYTKVAGDTTVTLVATAIKDDCNKKGYTTGFTATSALGVVTFTAKEGLGTYLNSAVKITITLSATPTIAQTLVDFTGGVASVLAPSFYHIQEYFRVNPTGVLYCGGFVTLATDGSDILTLQNYANGECKQIAFYEPLVTFATSKVTALQTIANTLLTDKTPSQIILANNLNGVTLSALTNLNALTGTSVSVCIGQDAGKLGLTLAKGNAKSITCIGAMLGAVSLANVQEDIAWVGKFNISDTLELETLGFANGVLVSDQTKVLLDQLNDFRFVFLVKQRAIAGSYFNDSHNACVVSSDYAYIENNRVINKAIRFLDVALTPYLNSNIDLNSDGTISDLSIEVFTSACNVELESMKRNNNISDYSVSINSAQNVLSTGLLTIGVVLIPKGVARNINVNIGFALKL
jgi:hypothetical protein